MPAASSSLMVFKPHGASSTTLRSQLPCWGACRIATLTERVEPVTTKRNRSPENRRPREDALRRLEMLPSSLLDEPSTFLPIEGERSAVMPFGQRTLVHIAGKNRLSWDPVLRTPAFKSHRQREEQRHSPTPDCSGAQVALLVPSCGVFSLSI
jgi:hypothetical protein